MHRISTGSKNLDNLLCGGIESKALTEFYGATRSGKTQICHTLCVMVAQNNSEKGVSLKSIYIDTEGKFRPERITGIAKSRGFEANTILSNILCAKAIGVRQQELAIKKIPVQLDKDKSIKLLIIDSVTSNYRAENSRMNELPERQKKLYKFMRSLSSITHSFDIATVVTNQVNFLLRSGLANPCGGKIIADASDYRVSLKRIRNEPNKVVAKITASTYHPENETYIIINKKGIDDVQ
jgi:DNA repair protein RadA